MITFRQSFRRWLEFKDPDEKVGEIARAILCPLASYFKQELGVVVAVSATVVDFYALGFEEDSKPIVTCFNPDWADTFVRNVDKLRPTEVMPSVTARECLEVLNAIP